MSLLYDKISPLIESQFPAFYREEGPMFVNFVKEYYKWMESNGNALYHARHMLEYGDIDKTLDEFIPHFQNKYLAGTPVINVANQRDLIKHTRDIYQTKGTVESLRLIFQMLFGEDVKVYYPGDDILRASDGEWVIPRYLELSLSDQTASYIGKDVIGSESGAKAFVERVDRRTHRGRTIDVLFISNIRPNATTGQSFTYDEYITVDGIIGNSPRVVGSLTRIEVTASGAGFGEGEIVDVISSRRGRQGRARVSSLGNRTGEVNYTLLDGGYGYTNTTAAVYVSSNVLSITALTNVSPGTGFPELSTIVQPLANVVYNTSNTTFNVGDLVYGSNATAVIATGFVLTVNASANWLLLSPHATSKITIDTIANANTTGSFNVGETVYQSNTSGNSAVGYVAIANATHVIIDQRVGPFVGNVVIRGVESNCTANVASVTTYAYNSTNFTDAAITKIVRAETNAGALKTSAVSLTVTANVVGANSTALGVYEISPHIYRLSIQANTITHANTITNSFAIGEYVYQANSTGNTAVGVVTAANGTHTEVNQQIGTFAVGSYLIGVTSNCHANTTSTTSLSQNAFKGGAKAWLYSTATGAAAEVMVTSSGLPGYFKIGGLTGTENVPVCTDIIQPYMSTAISGAPYGLPANTSAGYTSVIATALTKRSVTIGTILSLTEKYPGFNNTAKPFVVEIEKQIAAYNKPAVIKCIIPSSGSAFRVGERITQSIPTPRALITLTNVTGTFNYALHETIKQVRADANVVYGEVYSTAVANGVGTISVYVANTANTFDSVSSIVGLASGATANVTNVSLANVSVVASGVVSNTTTQSVSIKRLSFQDFVRGQVLTGSETGATANVLQIGWNSDATVIGNNANIDPIAGIANGTIVAVDVVDSGVFYETGEEVVLSANGNLTPGAGIARVESTGIMEGFWRGDKGTLDSTKRVQDNEYYQEYAYEIQSGVDRQVYESAINSIAHVAGTRMYSKYVKETYSQSQIDAAPTTYGVLTNVAVPAANWPAISALTANTVVIQKNNSGANVAVGYFAYAKDRAINSIVTLANTSGTFTSNGSIANTTLLVGNTSIGTIQSVGREIY